MLHSTYHAVHEANEAPKGDSVILFDSVNRRKKIAHALNVTEVRVVFIVSQEHVFHLLQVHIRADISKWRVRVWMRDILSFE